MPILGCPRERCLAIFGVSCVGIDVVPLQQHLSLCPVWVAYTSGIRSYLVLALLGSTPFRFSSISAIRLRPHERCSSILGTSTEQNPHDPPITTVNSLRERCSAILNVSSVGIDVVLFQQHLHHRLTAIPGSPR